MAALIFAGFPRCRRGHSCAEGVAATGEFGRVAEQRCGCSKQWRARLMSLDRQWKDVEAALRWADGLGPELGGRAYSVDGALRLLRQWRRVQSGTAGSGPNKSAKRRAAGASRERQGLKEKLNAAQAVIKVLEEEIERLEATTLREHRQEVDDATKAQASEDR